MNERTLETDHMLAAMQLKHMQATQSHHERRDHAFGNDGRDDECLGEILQAVIVQREQRMVNGMALALTFAFRWFV